MGKGRQRELLIRRAGPRNDRSVSSALEPSIPVNLGDSSLKLIPETPSAKVQESRDRPSKRMRSARPQNVSPSFVYCIDDLENLNFDFFEREVLQPKAVESLASAISEAGKVLEPIRVKDNKIVDGQHRILALKEIASRIKQSSTELKTLKERLDSQISKDELEDYVAYQKSFESSGILGTPLSQSKWLQCVRQEKVSKEIAGIEQRIQSLSNITFRFEAVEDEARIAAIRLGNVKSKLFVDQIRAVYLAVKSGSSSREVVSQLIGSLGSQRSAERRVEVVSALGELTPFVVEKVQAAVEELQQNVKQNERQTLMWEALSKESNLRAFLRQLRKELKKSTGKNRGAALQLTSDEISQKLELWFQNLSKRQSTSSKKVSKHRLTPASRKEFEKQLERIPNLTIEQRMMLADIYTRALEGKLNGA